MLSAKTVKDIPDDALNFINFISNDLGFPVKTITNGPDRSQIIDLTK